MKIIVFGATGSIGRHIVKKALKQGHEVTAFARNPEKLEMVHENLCLISGDVFNFSDVQAAISGQQAVMITLGSPSLIGNLRSAGTANIVNAMNVCGVDRLICQTTLGAGDSVDNLNFLWRYIYFGIILRFVMKDHNVQEDIVRKSGLDWTIVRPSAFTDEKGSNSYKSNFPSSYKGLLLKIPRIEVADFMLKSLNDRSSYFQSPGISY